MSEANRELQKNDFVFDPFGLNDDLSSVASPQPPPQVNRLTRSNEKKSTNGAISVVSTSSMTLPPRLVVKFRAHEEVSSVASSEEGEGGSSHVQIEGKISAQVTSSDARKNVPFCLIATNLAEDNIRFLPNEKYVVDTTRSLPKHAMSLIHIPKNEYAAVTIGSYSLIEAVQHMPLLVERKVTVHSSTVRVAVQVRSKLTNRGDLKDFTIAVAVPDRINGDTVEVIRGSGIYDDLKRTIKWSVNDLLKGESFMVSAQAQLFPTSTNEEGDQLKFPVLLRCSSNDDQISTVEFRAVETEEYPSSVSFSRSFSFRLLNRLP